MYVTIGYKTKQCASEYIAMYVATQCMQKSSLTVHDIIMSNPLRSAGVRELEIVTL